jgi:iron complex transport system substrate-binding protein
VEVKRIQRIQRIQRIRLLRRRLLPLLKHAFGETEIPLHPERIASINLEDMLLTLDVPLVFGISIGEGYYLNDRLKEKQAGLEIWGENLNLEAILDAKPDLIIASTAIEQTDYDNLARIAPTITYDREDWRNSMTAIGAALGMEEAAETALQNYDKQVADVKAALAVSPANGKSVAFIRMTGKDFRVYFPNYVDKETNVEWPTYAGVIYNELGLALDPKVAEWHKAEPNFQNMTASLEMLPELEADYLFVTLGGAGSTDDEIEMAKEVLAEMEQTGVWKSIPAVKQGHVVYVNARHWISTGPIAGSMKMADVAEALADTVQ